MQNIYDVLKNLNIEYTEYKHPAVFTVDEAENKAHVPGVHGKNLFLRNQKGDQHYLVVIAGSTTVNLKELAEKIHSSRLSFASPERLLKYLKVAPGSVSPFTLINDESKTVEVIVDENMLQAPQLAFHPNINTASLVINSKDLVKFLESTGNSFRLIKLS